MRKQSRRVSRIFTILKYWVLSMPRQRTLDEMLAGSSRSPQQRNSTTVQAPNTAQGASASTPRTTQVRLPRGAIRRKKSPISDDSDLSDNGSDVRDIDFEKPQAIQDDSESEPTPLSPQRRKAKLSQQRQRAPETPPSSDSGSKLSEESEDDLVPLTILTTRKGKKRALAESEDEAERPTRRRLVRGKARNPSSEEEDDPLDGVETERMPCRTSESPFPHYVNNFPRYNRNNRKPAAWSLQAVCILLQTGSPQKYRLPRTDIMRWTLIVTFTQQNVARVSPLSQNPR